MLQRSCADVEPLGPDRAGRPGPNRQSCRTACCAGHDRPPFHRIGQTLDARNRQGVRRARAMCQSAPSLRHAPSHPEGPPFRHRRARRPPRGLRLVPETPQTNRRGLQLRQDLRGHGADRLSRRWAVALPLHAEDGRQQSCQIAQAVGVVSQKTGLRPA